MDANSVDPRFFTATARQKEVFQQMMENEPQQVLGEGGLLFLGSRSCVYHHVDRLQDLGIKCIVMCCDRNPDEPKLFEYYHLPVNNESRDSGDQHARHVLDEDDHEHCNHKGCGDLHLLERDANNLSITLVDKTNAWIDERLAAGKPVLVHGYDGVTNSAAIVIAYLMWKQQLSLQHALAKVSAVRPLVRLTSPIQADLERYEIKLAALRHKDQLKNVIPPRGGRKKKNKKKQALE